MRAAILLLMISPMFAADENAPAVYKSGADLMAVLAKAQPKGDQSSSPVVNDEKYRINVVKRTSAGVAMAHATGPAKGSEVHYIIEGAATVVTGGTLMRGTPSKIDGGVTQHVAKGDVLFIPSGTPHWYKDVEGTVTYLEVRFDVETKK